MAVAKDVCLGRVDIYTALALIKAIMMYPVVNHAHSCIFTEFNLKKNKGQTFVEFLLVFVVLLLATNGVWVMYKGAWKKRYENTAVFSGAAAALLKVGGVGDVDVPIVGTIKTDYVK